MVLIAWLFGAVLILSFGGVLLVGAPYMPTIDKAGKQALDLLALRSGQTLYELGCGDGRMLGLAAQRGLKAVGYELNPFLVLIAKLRTWRYRRQVRVVWGNFWKADLGHADGVFVFLLDRFMPKLDAKLTNQNRHLKLVSHAFKIPGKKAAKTVGAMFLYEYS